MDRRFERHLLTGPTANLTYGSIGRTAPDQLNTAQEGLLKRATPGELSAVLRGARDCQNEGMLHRVAATAFTGYSDSLDGLPETADTAKQFESVLAEAARYIPNNLPA